MVAPDSDGGVAPEAEANSVTVHGPAGDDGWDPWNLRPALGKNNMWKDEAETEFGFVRAVYDLKHTDMRTRNMTAKAKLET